MSIICCLWLFVLLVDTNAQQCTIEGFQANILNIVDFTEATDDVQTFTVNSTYYNCL